MVDQYLSYSISPTHISSCTDEWPPENDLEKKALHDFKINV